VRRAAPDGRFFAFEPIPYLSDILKSKYRGDERVRVFNCFSGSGNRSRTHSRTRLSSRPIRSRNARAWVSNFSLSSPIPSPWRRASDTGWLALLRRRGLPLNPDCSSVVEFY